MDLVYLILGIAVVAFLIYLITTYIPMDPMFKTAIHVIVLIAIVLYLLKRFAIIPNVL
jgi:uncharacterized membrane protein